MECNESLTREYLIQSRNIRARKERGIIEVINDRVDSPEDPRSFSLNVVPENKRRFKVPLKSVPQYTRCLPTANPESSFLISVVSSTCTFSWLKTLKSEFVV